MYSTRIEMGQEEDRIQRFSTLNYRAPEMCDLYRYVKWTSRQNTKCWVRKRRGPLHFDRIREGNKKKRCRTIMLTVRIINNQYQL